MNVLMSSFLFTVSFVCCACILSFFSVTAVYTHKISRPSHRDKLVNHERLEAFLDSIVEFSTPNSDFRETQQNEYFTRYEGIKYHQVQNTEGVLPVEQTSLHYPLKEMRTSAFDGAELDTKKRNTRDAQSGYVVHVPLTFVTIAVLIALLAFSVLGAVYVYKLCTRPRCTCPICEGEFEIEKPLGSGGFGSVFRINIVDQYHKSNDRLDNTDLDETNDSVVTTSAVQSTLQTGSNSSHVPSQYVLKRIPVENFNDASVAQEEARDLRSLDHPRIVRYQTDFLHFTPEFAGGESQLYVCIVMELCSMDLRKLLERVRSYCPGWIAAKQKGKIDFKKYMEHTHTEECAIPESVIVRIVAQVAEALQYCHGKGIIHRDVKCQNAFLTHDGNIRLGDFGLARQVRRPITNFTDAGTDCYKAPEVLLGGRRDGRAGDIWGLGLLLHEATTLTHIWERSRSGIAADVLQRKNEALREFLEEIPSFYSPLLRRLIRNCLAFEPNERPTPSSILRSKLIRSIYKGRPSWTQGRGSTQRPNKTPFGPRTLEKSAILSPNDNEHRGWISCKQINFPDGQEDEDGSSPIQTQKSAVSSIPLDNLHSNSAHSENEIQTVDSSGESMYNWLGWDPATHVKRNIVLHEALRELPFDENAAGIFEGYETFLASVQQAGSIDSDSSKQEDGTDETSIYQNGLDAINDLSQLKQHCSTQAKRSKRRRRRRSAAPMVFIKSLSSDTPQNQINDTYQKVTDITQDRPPVVVSGMKQHILSTKSHTADDLEMLDDGSDYSQWQKVNRQAHRRRK